MGKKNDELDFMPSYDFQTVIVDYNVFNQFSEEDINPKYYRKYYYSWSILKKISKKYLSEIDHTILMLYYKYGFTQEIISMVLRISRQSVSWHLKRGILILQDIFDRYHKFKNKNSN